MLQFLPTRKITCLPPSNNPVSYSSYPRVKSGFFLATLSWSSQGHWHHPHITDTLLNLLNFVKKKKKKCLQLLTLDLYWVPDILWVFVFHWAFDIQWPCSRPLGTTCWSFAPSCLWKYTSLISLKSFSSSSPKPRSWLGPAPLPNILKCYFHNKFDWVTSLIKRYVWWLPTDCSHKPSMHTNIPIFLYKLCLCTLYQYIASIINQVQKKKSPKT